MDRKNNPRFWTLEKRLNWQQQGLYQPFPHLSDRQFVELLEGEDELWEKWRSLSPELRMQMLTQEQRECLMYSYLNLDLEQVSENRKNTHRDQEATLDGTSPISDWFLFHNQSVTPDERQTALQRLAEQKGMDRAIYEAVRNIPTSSNRWAFERAQMILNS
ncbi:MAG: hypothetical protein JOZ78_00775 [Chroococcidiopsidaceae cyanobacterium CP_BM_ER_R8_30]|nr:hypothetical protein [Chroococcidiopsidaceae cyanobacterium CP_BM_ER_R8_30]